MKLLSFWASPFSKRVEWALKLKGVEYEYVEEDIFNKSSLLLELNPVHKKIPVLVHGHKTIAESFIIIEYIDETWKQYPLLPHDPYERALARFWANFTEQKVTYQCIFGFSHSFSQKPFSNLPFTAYLVLCSFWRQYLLQCVSPGMNRKRP